MLGKGPEEKKMFSFRASKKRVDADQIFWPFFTNCKSVFLVSKKWTNLPESGVGGNLDNAKKKPYFSGSTQGLGCCLGLAAVLSGKFGLCAFGMP